MIRRLPAERQHLVLMLALTFSTGMIDAVGYLGLDRVFTGNMTGNVVILGMGLAGAEDLPVLGPALALIGFLVGAAFGGRVLKGAAKGWSRRTTVLLVLVGVVIMGLSVAIFLDPEPTRPVALTLSTLLGTAMGVQAATARLIGVKDVTTVVITSTLTGLAADSVLGGGTGADSGRRSAAVLLILAGAGTGAALLTWHLGAGLLAAALITLLVAAVGARSPRTD
ncbi:MULTISPECIES: YoaK family protein [Aeromicrobium]|uniref:YoaK family protein n=1 Tax=Aeromicrobium TaxID=2040 RepID=UPI001CA9C3E4|nr:YoaK family protein [Aeromicrobium sp. 636]